MEVLKDLLTRVLNKYNYSQFGTALALSGDSSIPASLLLFIVHFE